jgi:hypothetical protein
MTAPACADVCCSASCLLAAKAGFAALLTLEAVACTVLGAWISRRAKAVRIANTMAAGVFLASAFVHILPDAVGLLSGDGHGGEHHADEKFPVANVVTLALFLALAILGTALLDRCGSRREGSHAVPAVYGACCHSDVSPVDADAPAPNGVHADTSEAHRGVDVESGGGRKEESCLFVTPPFLRAGVFVSAMSMHSLLESISFGLTPDFPSAFSIFTAVAAHRWIVCTAVLARLSSSSELRATQRTALYSAFVLVLPVGALVGAALTGLPPTVEGAFVALAGFAFLYLGMEGVCIEFLHHGQWKGVKYVALVFGAALMVAVEGALFAAHNVS